jgi:S-adenosylmethionine/arginine decarboxylase-like enzyme
MKEEPFVPDHTHLLVRGYLLTPPLSETMLNLFLEELVKKIRMKVVAGPTSTYVSDPGNEGVTGTVTLATSHASIHVWDQDNPALFQFDLYSCSRFTPEEVLNFIDDWYGIDSSDWVFIDRNNGDFKEIRRGEFKGPEF